MTRNKTYGLAAAALATLCALGLGILGCTSHKAVVDEAKAAGKTRADFPQAADDFFRDMDGGIALTPDEVRGRNTWVVWTGGNDAFWDYMAGHSFGSLDLLKVLDSRNRGKRFQYYGMMNDPEFQKATQPDRWGLWLDEQVGRKEPFDEAVYGRPSGVVGLRLFPNPDFDAAAQKKWNAELYYTNRNYYYDRKLVRPYRVGMSCGFCHVGPHPLKPPADPESPKWENLSNNVGAQYFWPGRIFANQLPKNNFVWHVFNSQPPGTIDTSAIASDNINNPRTMNAIYQVGARLATSEPETMAGGTLAFDYVKATQGQNYTFPVPHVLKDGADSIGIQGALNRVYINIGTFHQEWLRHFRPLVGGKKQTPIEVAVAQENSVYWQATEDRVGNLAAFFLKAATPHYLKDAPGGAAHLTTDASVLGRGKVVFAENCARCHSSKQPANLEPGTPEYVDWMRQEVQKPDFLADNYLSTDARYPITQIGTNSCATLATNALSGHIWDNFSSQTYKNLPAVGPIDVMNPIDLTGTRYDMPGGGRGYLRAPSLVSLWSTAPFFHNNALGKFTNDPSVKGRMEAFDDAVGKLLWPDRRANDDCAQTWGLPFCGPVYQTTAESWIILNKGFLPDFLKPLLDGDELRIGPIPARTPIALLTNINLEGDKTDLLKVLLKIKKDLKRIKDENLDEVESRQLLRGLVPDLLKVSKCPDFQVDRGHTFGSDLAEADKRALVEYLKTL